MMTGINSDIRISTLIISQSAFAARAGAAGQTIIHNNQKKTDMEETVKGNACASAFPNKIERRDGTWHEYGLTKREYFAGLAMQGIMVNVGINGLDFYRSDEIAEAAIKIADDLLS